jgi:hypothetical protein
MMEIPKTLLLWSRHSQLPKNTNAATVHPKSKGKNPNFIAG